MKSLRILTGFHAGAQLRLMHGRQRIASDDDADVQITDWQHAAVELTEDEGGNWMWKSIDEVNAGEAQDGASAPQALRDFEPVRFGDVALCIGPADAPWPADLELLTRLMEPVVLAGAAAASSLARPVRRLWTIGGTIAASVLGASLLGLVLMRPASGAKADVPLAEQVRRAVASAGGDELSVKMVGPQVSVEGLLERSADVARVRIALQPFGPDTILHRYSAASELARALADATRSARIEVVHEGGGVFRVRGQTDSLANLRETVMRVATDLGPQVTRIDIDVTEDLIPTPSNATATLLSGDLQYVEGPGGMRRLSVVEPHVEAGSTPSAAASAPQASASQPLERRP